MKSIKDARYELGLALLQEGEYDEAVAAFEAAIAVDPDFTAAHCALARAHLQQHELDKAHGAISAALTSDATDHAAQVMRDTIVTAYYDVGKEHASAKRYVAAVEHFQKGLDLRDDLGTDTESYEIKNEDIHYNLGVTYIKLGRYPEATQALKEAVHLDDSLVRAHYHLGYAYVEQGSYTLAIQHLERAIDISPSLERAYYHLARAHRGGGNLEAATYAVTEALRLDPTYAAARELAGFIKQGHYNKGVTHLANEQYSEASTAFQNAITLDEGFITAYYNLGLSHFKMGHYQEALPPLQKTIALDPTYKAAYHTLALVYFNTHDLVKASETLKALLKLDPNYQPAISLLSAIDPSFTPPEPDQPDDTVPDPKPQQEVHYEQGMKYKDAKKWTAAIAEFQRAIDLDIDFAEAHLRLAEIYLELGELDQAETAANTALKIDPNLQEAHQLLEVIKKARPAPEPEPKQDPPTPEPKKQTKTERESPVEQDFRRGLAFLGNGQYNEAAAAFKRVIKVEPSRIDAHFGLVQAYLELGAFESAKAARLTALDIDNTHQELRDFLSLIQKAEKVEKRKKLWKKIRAYIAAAVILAILGVAIFKIWIETPEARPIDVKIAVVLEEPTFSKNGVLDAGERARLVLTITNSGDALQNVQIRFLPESIPDVAFDQPSPISIDGLKTVSIPIRASQKVNSRVESLEIQLHENGELLARETHQIIISK